MAFGLKIPLHGRSHMHKGSDPITAFIEFLVNNMGGWLNITTPWDVGTTAASAPNTDNLGQAAMLFSSVGTASYLPIVIRASDDGGATWTEYGFGAGVADWWNAELHIIDSGGDTMASISDTGDHNFKLRTAKAFTVQNDSGDNIFQIDEDGDVHIETGGNIIADL